MKNDVKSRLAMLFTVVLLATGAPDGHPDELPGQQLRFQGSGLAVAITAPQGTISDEQALKALEESAQLLRKRMESAKQGGARQVQQQPAPDAVFHVLESVGEVHQTEPLSIHDWEFTLFPKTLFWQPMLANPSEPRFYVKPSTLRNDYTEETIDTAIGGVAGLYRFSPLGMPDQGVQLDVFAVVLSRWTQRQYSVDSDYRYGFPLTFAWGNMHAKIGYEHTSSHLGDDTMEITGRSKIRNIHDDLVLGLDYRFFNALRVYGVYAYPLVSKAPVDAQRFDWGVEWSRQETTSVYGQPFAAFDMVLRQEQGYTPNATAQVGWQWLDMESGHSVRLAVEYFEGKSTFGQFYLDRERWVAVGAYLDF